MSVLRPVFPLVVMPLFWLVAPWCSAEGTDFRIETSVYIGHETKPASRLLTLFDNTQVYDFPVSQSGDIVILDSKQNRFTLFSQTRAEHTLVTTKRLLQHEQTIERHIQRENIPSWFRELAQPKFELVTDGSKPVLKLTGSAVNYEVHGTNFKDDASLQLYFLFADATTRLNYFLMNWPPQARLSLNQEMLARRVMPASVLLSIDSRATNSTSPSGNSRYHQKVKHHVEWHLTKDDRKKIAQVKHNVSQSEMVSFDQFLAATR